MENISKVDRDILDLLQEDFPLSCTPYKDMAEKLSISERELLQRIDKMKNNGLIRRIGGIINSSSFGFYSTLCACKVPEEKIEQVAEVINARPGVSHNYLRDHEYNIWFTLTASSKEKVLDEINSLEEQCGVDIINLPAKKVYKIKVFFDMGDRNEL